MDQAKNGRGEVLVSICGLLLATPMNCFCSAHPAGKTALRIDDARPSDGAFRCLATVGWPRPVT